MTVLLNLFHTFVNFLLNSMGIRSERANLQVFSHFDIFGEEGLNPNSKPRSCQGDDLFLEFSNSFSPH